MLGDDLSDFATDVFYLTTRAICARGPSFLDPNKRTAVRISISLITASTAHFVHVVGLPHARVPSILFTAE